MIPSAYFRRMGPMELGLRSGFAWNKMAGQGRASAQVVSETRAVFQAPTRPEAG